MALIVVFHEILVISEKAVGLMDIHPSDNLGINKKMVCDTSLIDFFE